MLILDKFTFTPNSNTMTFHSLSFCIKTAIVLIAMSSFEISIMGQKKVVNYDESAVPAYTLPDPLRYSDGAVVKDTSDWISRRRPEILSLFETEMYGKTPGRKLPAKYSLVSLDTMALNGLAVRKEVRIEFTSESGAPSFAVTDIPAEIKETCACIPGS